MKIKNTTAGNLTVAEILKRTTLVPGQEIDVDPATTVIEIE